MPQYEAELAKLAALVDPFIDRQPMSKISRKIGVSAVMDLVRSLFRARNDIPDHMSLLTSPAATILDKWFDNDLLKGMLATDAVIGSFLSPKIPGSAYVLLHHVMGESFGEKGVWAHVKGGMGTLTSYLAELALEAGVNIRLDTPVDEILVEGNQACGLRLKTGEEILA